MVFNYLNKLLFIYFNGKSLVVLLSTDCLQVLTTFFNNESDGLHANVKHDRHLT